VEEPTAHQAALEITDDATVLRTILGEVIKALRGKDGRPKSRERAIVVTKLQEACFWLVEDMAQEPPNLLTPAEAPKQTDGKMPFGGVRKPQGMA
jgi:hypothetical protein